MNTKGILIAILALGSITLINAQQPAGYFFKEFTPGKVLLKNKQFAKGKFNYDCINKEMHFLNESTDMVIENLEDIDTVVIDIHRFIPFEGHFMEVMTDQHTTLFIDWKVKPKDIGSGRISCFFPTEASISSSPNTERSISAKGNFTTAPTARG